MAKNKMEGLQGIYEDQTKLIKNLYEQSFCNALEYVNLQIEKYGDFARGLLLYLIEISSEEELDQIISKYKDACFMQQLKSTFIRNEESIYQKKYGEIVDKIKGIVSKTTTKDHDNGLLSISKFISEGNAERVRELLEQGESPHSLVRNMPIKEYAQQYGNKQVIDLINQYLQNEEVNKVDDNVINISEIVEKLNSPKYTDIEKLSYILNIEPNKQNSNEEIDYVTSIKDDRLVDVICELNYKDNYRNIIIKLIEEKRFKVAFKFAIFDGSIRKQVSKVEHFSKYVILAKTVITSKDLKEIFDLTPEEKLNMDIPEVLQKLEEGKLDDIPALDTRIYNNLTIGQLIGRMADLETLKVISANRNADEISELLHGAILLDKKDCFDYILSLPIDLTEHCNNFYYILAAQRFNYAEALANRYPKMKIRYQKTRLGSIIIPRNPISGFWVYSKDLPITHPLFSLVGPVMLSFVEDVPSEKITFLIEKMVYSDNINGLLNTSIRNHRFDIASALVKDHQIIDNRFNNIELMLNEWTGSDDEKHVFQCILENHGKLSNDNCSTFIKKAASLDDSYPLETLVRNEYICEYIAAKELEAADLLLSRHFPKIIDSVQYCFNKEGNWMIGATSPNVFMISYRNLRYNVLMAMMAIFNNQHENLKFLLNNGLNPNSKGVSPFNESFDINPNGDVKADLNDFLLVFAVKRGDFESFKILFNAGADANIRNNDGDSILLTSLKAGRQDIVEHLLHNDVVKIDNMELDALLKASCANGYMSYANFFIGRGANPRNEECLINAARGPHIEIAKMLMKTGCRPTYSALEAACKANSIPMIDLLFENGLKVESYEELNHTIEVIEALIRHGVRVNHTRKYSIKFSKYSIRKVILLISSGTDFTPLLNMMFYCYSKSLTSLIFSFLIDSGLDVNFMHQNMCLLSNVCTRRNLDVVKLLIERGADIEKLSSSKLKGLLVETGTPLLYACNAENNRDVVSYLLEKGANPEPDCAPSELMLYAAENNYVDLLIPRLTGKANWNPNILANAIVKMVRRRRIDEAVKVMEFFLNTKYEAEDRLMICEIANGRDYDHYFEFIRRVIEKGFSFEGFDVCKCSSPDVAALCIEAGASSWLLPSPEILRTATAMCADVHSISNTEGNIFFIRRLPVDEMKEVFAAERALKDDTKGRKTSLLGRRTLLLGQRTSQLGQRTSILGQRTSILGRRVGVASTNNRPLGSGGSN